MTAEQSHLGELVLMGYSSYQTTYAKYFCYFLSERQWISVDVKVWVKQ